MGLFDSSADDKSETIRRLTRALAEANEVKAQLLEQNRAAVGARKGAVDRVRELEDILRLKERMAEDQERQVAGAFETAEQLRSELADSRRQLAAFREEQEAFPLSDMDLLHRYQRQTALFELIQESLTCPICYSAFAKDAEGRPVSLQCGHSFCETCFGTWEAKHLNAFKNSHQQGAYGGAECPECRSANVRKGRVRIWAMEEVVRLVERGAREAEIPYTPASAATAPAVAPPRAAPVPASLVSEPHQPPAPPQTAVHTAEPEVVAEGEDSVEPQVQVGGDIDEAAASFLRPRRSTPYGAVLR